MAVTGLTASASYPFTRSTIGRKAIMAASGFILFGFVLVHMVGNLQVYAGRAMFNGYSEFLHHFIHGTGLWIARAALLAAVVLHVWFAWTTTRRSWAARPTGYKEWTPSESTLSSRTMRWSGVIILLYVLYHLADFTFGTAAIHPAFVPGDPYTNFVTSFQRVPVAIVYIIGNVALGFHLRHGTWSMLQTLGLSHPRYRAMAVDAALVFALVITIANVSFPLAVLSGIVHL